jgi:hypothetical protein
MNSRRWSILLLTSLATMTVAQAQSSSTAGAARGIVSKKGGGRLAGAQVTVRNLETNFTRTQATGANGEYTFALLPVGPYEITVAAPGMKTIKDSAVRVTLGVTASASFTLDKAQAEATVEVVASSEAIDVRQVSTSSAVDEKLVASVPLVSRNFTEIARLSPGITSGSGVVPKLVVEGGRQIFNAIQIDGASNNSAFFNEQRGGVYTPFIFGADTIKELQIVTNGFDVQYGQAGATVNAVTKTGTNEFTGSVLWQMRKTSWSAKPQGIPYDPTNTFNTPTNLQRFNDSTNVNFNVGGAIIKDKLWYFGGVERFHKSITANPIPTPINGNLGMTQTDFNNLAASKLGKVVTNTKGLTLAQEFGNPGAGIAPNAYPMENTNTVYFGRLDWAASENHRFVLRLNYQTMEDTYLNTSANPNNAESNNIPTKTNSISWVVEANDIWSTELMTESRLQLAREARPMHANAVPGTPSLSIPSSTSFMAFGTKTSTPRESNENTTQFFSATTFTRGDLQIKGGVDLMKVDVDNQFFQNNAGAFNFGTYGAAADWANGTLSTTTNNGAISYSGAVSSRNGRIPMWTQTGSVFGQVQYSGLLDKRLTVVAGLRTTNQSFSNNPAPNPNFAGLDQGMGGNSIDPRLAFSYDADGKGTTVVRGGYGQFTSPTPLLLHSNTMTGNGQIITNYSFSLNRTTPAILAYFNNGPLSAANLISGTNMRHLTDAELATLAASGNFSAGSSSTSLWDPNNKLSKSKKLSLGVEHDFGSNFVVGLTGNYVKYENLQRFENINLGQVGGTGYNDGYAQGINLWNGTRPNTAIIGGRKVDFNKASITAGNPVGGFSDVYLVKTDGWGYYRGISLTARKTWNEKTGIMGNLTWSKSQDTGSFERGTYTSASGNFSSELGASLTPDPQAPASNFGLGDNDRTWVGNLVAYFPIGLGIQASIRYLYQTGLPYGVYDANDLNKDGMANHFYTGHVRNDARQPSFTQTDLRFSRSFQVYKKLQLEGIVDIYNLFNKADFTVPSPNGYFANTTAGAANAAFGQLAAVDKNKTRELQVGIKAKF